jgi:flagellar hook protein FlgE
MPFNIALSGLNAASTDLEVTGNNIANAATTGFKESRAEFADVYANSLTDVATTAPGRGVRVTRVAQQFTQGTVDFTSNNLDIAINGEGFFVLQGDNGETSYTRAGAYSTDRDGVIVNHANQKLQGYPASTLADGTTSFATGALTDITLPLAPSDPTATSQVTSSLNLDARETTPPNPFSNADPDSYNH